MAMDAVVAWFLFFVKLILAMLIVGILTLLVIILIANFIYRKFVKPPHEEDLKD